LSAARTPPRLLATSPQTAGDAPTIKAIEQARRVEYVAFLDRVPFALKAHDLGYATGICKDYTIEQSQYANVDVPVLVLDNDFRDSDVERWQCVRAARTQRRIIGDVFAESEPHEYVEVALEVSDSDRDQAYQFFRSAQNGDLLRGSSTIAFAAASVYEACRCNGRSREGVMADAIRGYGRGERLKGDCSATPRYVGGTGRLTTLINKHCR